MPSHQANTAAKKTAKRMGISKRDRINFSSCFFVEGIKIKTFAKISPKANQHSIQILIGATWQTR
jgi:hypothetical protein